MSAIRDWLVDVLRVLSGTPRPQPVPVPVPVRVRRP